MVQKQVDDRVSMQDASFSFVMDRNRLGVYLTIVPPQNGGRWFTRAEVDAELMRLDIKPERIDRACLDRALQSGVADNLQIAFAKPPKQGIPTQFIFLVDKDNKREGAHELDDEVIDFRDHNDEKGLKLRK